MEMTRRKKERKKERGAGGREGARHGKVKETGAGRQAAGRRGEEKRKRKEMALKFLNKKGWHTGSLRNIENVWKAEQKHEAEQKKLEELRKQIQEERERNEFRLLQQQAGLIPSVFFFFFFFFFLSPPFNSQERLDFLYDSGLAVGKGSSDGFKALETPSAPTTEAASSSKKQDFVPGALFEEKPQSANDAWRKLHSDPLLLIRQREQEALSQIKNNPVQMAIIRKSVEKTKKHGGKHKSEEHKKHRKKSKHEKNSSKYRSDSEVARSEEEEGRQIKHRVDKHRRKSKHSSGKKLDLEGASRKGEDERSRTDQALGHPNKPRHSSKDHKDFLGARREDRRAERSSSNIGLEGSARDDIPAYQHRLHHKQYQTASKLSEEEKAARAREMMLDAEAHEEQRWKRLKKASEADALEKNKASASNNRNFLDAAQKSVYGTEAGGSSSIEESIRRRTYYLQGKSDREANAFRR
ncbi:hypothetical protein ACLOJK_033961 [Asimina triloba]